MKSKTLLSWAPGIGNRVEAICEKQNVEIVYAFQELSYTVNP